MKPNTQITENKGTERADETRRFPLTDYNFHSTEMDASSAPCAKMRSRGFHTLSQEYFKTEANHYFLAEAGIFSAILASVVLPLIYGAGAVVQLVGALAL